MNSFNGKSVDLFECTREKLMNNHVNLQLIYSEVDKKFKHINDDNILMNELNLLESLSKKLKLKKVLINWDLNPMNILIMSNCESNKNPKTLLIDYEYAHPNIRAYDLGSVIHGATLQPLTGKRISDEQIMNSLQFFEEKFLKHYHQEYIKYKTNQNGNENDDDSLLNVLIEGLFGSCFVWIHYIAIRIEVLFLMCPETAAACISNELESSVRFYRIAKSRLYEKASFMKEE